MWRSLLFVPGDSEAKIAKSETVATDAVIFDLEDAVAAGRRPEARRIVTEYLQRNRSSRRATLFVRINPLHTGDALTDLAAVMAGAPDGIVLPKSASAEHTRQLGHYLDAFEAQHGLTPQSTRVLPIATETAAAVFNLGGYAGADKRLAALTWGAEDLGAAVGSRQAREGGQWTPPFALARSLCLFGATAAGVPAIDTLHADFRDDAGLATAARQARRDGFGGMLAIHPAQVPIIHEAFAPTETERAHARAVVALFEANPGAGVLSLDGKMLDWPHLMAARRVVTEL